MPNPQLQLCLSVPNLLLLGITTEPAIAAMPGYAEPAIHVHISPPNQPCIGTLNYIAMPRYAEPAMPRYKIKGYIVTVEIDGQDTYLIS